MSYFDEYLYKYGLHDCKIDNTYFECGKIILNFNSGLYKLDSSGNETDLTIGCKMVVEVEETDPDSICDHITINRIIQRKEKELDFEDFANTVDEFGFDIDIHFYSNFCNTILLKGYIGNGKYEMVISEVKRIDFLFG